MLLDFLFPVHVGRPRENPRVVERRASNLSTQATARAQTQTGPKPIRFEEHRHFEKETRSMKLVVHKWKPHASIAARRKVVTPGIFMLKSCCCSTPPSRKACMLAKGSQCSSCAQAECSWVVCLNPFLRQLEVTSFMVKSSKNHVGCIDTFLTNYGVDSTIVSIGTPEKRIRHQLYPIPGFPSSLENQGGRDTTNTAARPVEAFEADERLQELKNCEMMSSAQRAE